MPDGAHAASEVEQLHVQASIDTETSARVSTVVGYIYIFTHPLHADHLFNVGYVSVYIGELVRVY